MIRRVIPFVLCALILSGCQKKVDKENSAIVVNGQSISKAKVNQAAEMVRESIIRAFPQKSLQSMGSEIYKAAAYQLVSNIVMLEEAKKRHIEINQVIVDSNFNMIKKRFPDDAAFQKELTLAGQTEAGMKKQFSDGMQLDSLLKVLLASLDSVKEDDCRAFYAKNADKYVSRTKIRASQIMFPFDTSLTPAKKEALMKTATEACALVKSGKSVESVIKKYSAKGAMGGDIGWFGRGDMKPDIENALATLKQGETADVIATDVGLVIIQKTGEEAGKPMAYDEVKDHVRFMVDMKHKNEFMTNYIDSLVSRAKVVYNDTSLTPLPKGQMDSLLTR